MQSAISNNARRVLLVNPASPLSFWTLEKMTKIAGAGSMVAPLGLITVAALLPDHWEYRLADLCVRPMTEEDWDWGDVVMVTGMIFQRESMIQVIREAKQRGKTVVVGGPYVTSVPKAALDAGCDFLLQGEAEGVIDELVTALEEGRSGGVIESDKKPDLSTSPIPRFDLLNFKDYVTIPIQTSRGCPFDCEFCDIVNLYGRSPRNKSPKQVLAELEALYRAGYVGPVFISDDNFVGNRSRARAILREMIPWLEHRGEPFYFWAQVSVNLGQDPDTMDLMTRANFAYVFIGIETPDESVLAAHHKYQNLRSPLADSIKNITRNGLSVIGSFIIGFDGEKPGAGERICELVENTDIAVVHLNVLQALPNTRLWSRLESEGRLLDERTSGQTTAAGMNYVPSRPEQEITDEFVNAWTYMYEPSRFLQRAYRQTLATRPTRASSRGEGPAEQVVTAPVPRTKVAEKWENTKRLLRVVRFWKLGTLNGFLFWRLLFGVFRNNPSRMLRYTAAIGLGPDLIDYGDYMIRKHRENRTPPKPDHPSIEPPVLTGSLRKTEAG